MDLQKPWSFYKRIRSIASQIRQIFAHLRGVARYSSIQAM